MNKKKGERVMNSSVFVKIERYREMYDTVKQLKAKLEEAKQVLKKIKDLKSQEDAELESWQRELSTVEQKLSEVGQAISER